MVIMQRSNGTVDFNRTYEDCKFGLVMSKAIFGMDSKTSTVSQREKLELRIEIGNAH